jgi:hypothetical protein
MSQLQPVLTFDGIDDHVEVPYSEKINPEGVFTLSCWAKPTKAGKYNALMTALFMVQGAYLQGYQLYLSDKLWLFGVAGADTNHSSPVPVLNTWTHVAATFEYHQAKLYVNGQIVSDNSSSNHRVNKYVPLLIGAAYPWVPYISATPYVPSQFVPQDFFTGQIAEVCIWNKVRTQQEIQSDMNKSLTGKEEGLVGYWPLNEGSGNTAIDKTGNGNNGIIKGSATWGQEESPLEPAKPTTGEFQIPTNSNTGVEFTNKLAKDSSYKLTPSGTWKTASDPYERTAAGVKGFSPALQPYYIEGVKPHQQALKYPNNTYLALVSANKTTGVVTEVREETTIVLKPGETLIFLVNYFTEKYDNNTGTLTVKWSAS